MKKLLLSLLVLGIATSAYAGVKKVYVGSHAGGYAHYVIECTNGNSYSDLSQKLNGYWYSGASNMGDDYKGLSINSVADKKCN
jgi:hypothetical protein